MDDLSRIQATLESSSTWWGHVLVAATIAVVVGVLIEVWATVLEVKKDLQEERKIKAHHVLTFVGAGIVAMFVAIEGDAEYQTVTKETKLRSINAEIQSGLEAKADEATKEAVELTQKFGGLHDFVKAATDELDKDRDQLNKAHDETIAAAAKVKGAVEEINDLNRQLDNLTKDRKINIPNVILKVARFAGTPFDCESSEGREVDLMVYQLTFALEHANWSWKPDAAPDGRQLQGETFAGRERTTFIRSRTYRGIAVQVVTTDSSELHAAKDALASALRDEGIKDVTTTDLSEQDAAALWMRKALVHIIVGTKH